MNGGRSTAVPANTDPGQSELQDGFYQILAKHRQKAAAYDCLVLFSGGKDSTFIAHLLKDAGQKVCLLTVDNGFEGKKLLSHARTVARQVNCDLYIYQPNNDIFVKLYRLLMTEPKLLTVDTNPLCFFCGRFFMSLGVEFAERIGIPIVAYGATPEQLNKGQRSRSLRDVQLFHMVSQRIFRKNYEMIQSLSAYKNDPDIRAAFDKIFYNSPQARIIFPFQFVPYNVEHIKAVLSKKYDWKNASEDVDNARYLSAGCDLVKLFGVLTKKAGFTCHELAQFEKDFRNGLMNEETYVYNKELMQNIMRAEITPTVRKLVDKLGLAAMLEK
jgi:hypothetical protein